MVEALGSPFGRERRTDPRTDRGFSLLNLLRTRTERGRWEVAVLGTREGHLLASSRGLGDGFARRAAAHVSAHLSTNDPKDGEPFRFVPPKKPDVRLVAQRFMVRGQPVFLAVISREQEADSALVGDTADAVTRILNEGTEP